MDPITPDVLIPQPHELVARHGAPETIAGWKALADGLLTDQPCVFHRNLEISSRYAWIYKYMPAYLKWAGMAAFASHHVRLALFPLRLDRDRTGYVDIPHSLGRRRVLLLSDINTIRQTNNAIFDDIFWAHLAYASTDNGIDRLRTLLGDEPHYAPVLAGFETIDHGRRAHGRGAHLERQHPTPRTRTTRAWCNPTSTASPARSPGSSRSAPPSASRSAASATRLSYFTSFYYYALTGGIRQIQAWPRITRFDDRWRWILTCIVPRFRRFDVHTRLVDTSLRRVFDEARDYASNPCVLPQTS